MKTLTVKYLVYIALFVSIFFGKIPTVLASNPTVVRAMISGPNTVLIIFSEPVVTSTGDYIGVGGSVSGKFPSLISGNGTTNINLTFDGVTFIPGAKGNISIASSLKSSRDYKSFIPTTIVVHDGQTPTLTSFSIYTSDTLTSKNSNITVTFSTNKSVLAPSVTIGNIPVSVSGSDKGPFNAVYTVKGDNQNSLPITITLTDEAQNVSKITSGFTLGTVPSIASITSNAQRNGPLGVGSTIVFTLTPTFPVPNASIKAFYNGDMLSWSTDNGGKTYTATYTVRSDSNNQSFPTQIGGVVLTDQFGNSSAPASGNDIEKFVEVSYVPIPVESKKVETVAISKPTSLVVDKITVSKAKFTKTLKNGSTGSEVKELQKKLTSLGLYKGPITGTFGSATESAVKKFQAKYKLTQSGEVGPQTRGILNK